MTAQGGARSGSEVEDDWGRVPGLRPPLPASAPLVWFTALGLVLTAVVVLRVRPSGPLDQPNPAYQRDGLLLIGPVLSPEVAGAEFGGQPARCTSTARCPPLTLWPAGLPRCRRARRSGWSPLR